MKIGAIAPWLGGKRTLAPLIVRELGSHHQYFEPFCGGLAVVLRKPQARNETCNDLHGDVTNLAVVLTQKRIAVELYERLQQTLFAEELLDEARLRLGDAAEIDILHGPQSTNWRAKVERAYWFFLASWMGRNGTAGMERQDFQAAVRFTAAGGSPTVRFRNAIESIPLWHERLRNVVILRRDAFDILDRFEDKAGTAIYADPPYPQETRGGSTYLHDFGSGGKRRSDGASSGLLFKGENDDHQRLADVLNRYDHARIVVSTYDCPRYRELYDGWTFIPCAVNKQLANQNKRGSAATKTKAPEVLIVNGEAAAGAGRSGADDIVWGRK